MYDKPIGKNTKWDGDESTGNFPVRGTRIEEFLKSSLNSKAGCFYYDTTNNRYLVFSDEETRDDYLNDTTKVELIIASFDAPFNYTAKIILESPAYNAVPAGTTGHYIDFSFDVENKSGQSTGEGVICTYTFRKGTVKQTVTEQYAAGRSVHFNIDKYLSEGTNNITIAIQGQTTLAATTVAVTYQVVELEITNSLDVSQVYDLRNGSQTMAVPFSVKGYGTKVVEWYLDGELLDFVKNEDEVVDVEVSRTKYITLDNLSHGVHTLQMRAYTLVEGEKFYSDVLYREIIVNTGLNRDTITAIAMTVPSKYGVLTSRTLYGLVQYVPYTLRFATYSQDSSEIDVNIKLDDTVLGSVASENGVVNSFTLTPSKDGAATISIVTADGSSVINAEVAPTTMMIEEITDALQLDFRAIGKSNNSVDKDSWSYGDYTGTFKGFNWNNTSGWADNCLLINEGAEFGIDLAPLSGNPAQLGKTIEIEFTTENVNDDNAVICDLRNTNSGAGILITATSVALYSEAGVAIETSFKPNEFIRVAFVINKATGATNKCMSFIHINGKYARGTSWAATDRYSSDKTILFKGSEDALVKLKYVRIYDAALTADQLLNNHNLYRDSIKEMTEIYERNDVYAEGTYTFEPEKMAGRLPYMTITGDIPALENTTDKDKQIIVDIDYKNLQNPELSFSWKSAAFRPQGTSSMGYPKKNFRPYSNKVDSTVCYDSKGNIVPDRLYAFKPNAQRVDCWCLKADYAESSGTHNTGIARLWNDILMNATIDGEYVFRTGAQKAAIANGFKYDVRTTIDGFPILLFYRLTPNDPLIFIGKYNFNNDKSTPSVFGFEGIPGFDDSKMQCWEVLNNGNALALFTTSENFDKGWSEAFESRHPDTKTPNTANLKTFCQWMSGVSQTNFAREKWQHLDVYKVASYYIYLMRFGAVDQPVKNAMLTSEDGLIWYFILYDNDTVNGLTNEGKLVVPWNAIRTTIGADGQPYYAGPDSRLWNMLEADVEFMEIVRKVDEALYIAGLTYENIIKMFDEEQAGKWVERVYNQDAQYKYVGPYVEKGINNLFMLQGDRSTHRKYWLARRFALFDSLWVSGAYKANSIEIKCTNNTPAGQQITVKAGTAMDYGYGINNLPRESNVSLAEGEEHTFITSEVVNLGDPIRIYAAPNIESVDLSAMAGVLAVVTVANVYNKDTGTKLKKLIVGNATVENNSVTDISGLAQAERLEYLDVRNMKGLTSLNLSNQNYFKTLKAFGSGISSVQFANGAPVENLELPAQRTLTLEQMPYLNSLRIEDWSLLHTVVIKGCPLLSKNISFVTSWIDAAGEDVSLYMDNIEWRGVNYEDLIRIGSLSNVTLRGYAKITESSQEIIDSLSAVFGASVFDKNSDFFIDAPDSIFLSGPSEIFQGDSAQYNIAVFPVDKEGTTVLKFDGLYSGMTFDANTGVLRTSEYSTSSLTLTLTGTFYPEDGIATVKKMTITVKPRKYPTWASITGNKQLTGEDETYNIEIQQISEGIGNFSVQWGVQGDIATYAEIKTHTQTKCTLTIKEVPIEVVTGSLQAQLIRVYNNSVILSTKLDIVITNDTVATTSPGICQQLYNSGYIANRNYCTKEEAKKITSIPISSGTKNIGDFSGFQYFTSVTKTPNFRNSDVTRIILPESIVEISAWAFQGCKSLEYIEIPGSVTTWGNDVFTDSNIELIKFSEGVKSLPWGLLHNVTGVKNIELPHSLEVIYGKALFNTGIKYLKLGANVNNIYEAAIGGLSYETFEIDSGNKDYYSNGSVIVKKDTNEIVTACKNFVIPAEVEKIGNYAMSELGLTELTLPGNITSIGEYAFKDNPIKKIAFGEKLSSIGNYAFDSDTIEDIICPENTYVTLTYRSFGEYTFSTLKQNTLEETVFYLGATALKYLPGNNPTGNIILKSGTRGIAPFFMMDDTCIRSLRIPSEVVSIGQAAFYNSSIESFIFDQVEGRADLVIDYDAFDKCNQMVEFSFYSWLKFSTLSVLESLLGLTKVIVYEGVPLTAFTLSGCLNVKTIICHAKVAPTGCSSNQFGRSETTYTGRNSYNTGENILYVPQGATGYDGGDWTGKLLNPDKCGFTISYTL